MTLEFKMLALEKNTIKSQGHIISSPKTFSLFWFHRSLQTLFTFCENHRQICARRTDLHERIKTLIKPEVRGQRYQHALTEKYTLVM